MLASVVDSPPRARRMHCSKASRASCPKAWRRASQSCCKLSGPACAAAWSSSLARGLTLLALRHRGRSFGVRVIKPSPVLKACSPLLDHKDKSVRDGAKELAVSARCLR